MRKLASLLVAFSFLVMAAPVSLVYADGVPVSTDPENQRHVWTRTVYNNSSSDISSGNVVVWDTSSTDLTANGYPLITTTTSADDIHTAGVIYDDSCSTGSTCEIVVHGIVDVICLDSSDAVGADTTVGSATTAGYCGDYSPSANKRSLGVALEDGGGTDGSLISVFVNTLGAPAEQ